MYFATVILLLLVLPVVSIVIESMPCMAALLCFWWGSGLCSGRRGCGYLSQGCGRCCSLDLLHRRYSALRTGARLRLCASWGLRIYPWDCFRSAVSSTGMGGAGSGRRRLVLRAGSGGACGSGAEERQGEYGAVLRCVDMSGAGVVCGEEPVGRLVQRLIYSSGVAWAPCTHRDGSMSGKMLSRCSISARRAVCARGGWRRRCRRTGRWPLSSLNWSLWVRKRISA